MDTNTTSRKPLLCNGFLLFLLVNACSSSVTSQVISIDVHAAQHLLKQGQYRYLDVRTEEEFKNGHLENAFNIPYMITTPKGRVKNTKFIEQVLTVFRKEDHLIVGCQSGVRSVDATIDLLHSEFKNVQNMEGGYIAWIGNGLAVKKPYGAYNNEL